MSNPKVELHILFVAERFENFELRGFTGGGSLRVCACRELFEDLVLGGELFFFGERMFSFHFSVPRFFHVYKCADKKQEKNDSSQHKQALFLLFPPTRLHAHSIA